MTHPDCEHHRGKKAYRHSGAADRALRTIRRLGERREKKPVRSYPCPGCGRWFLTSMPEEP